jgi:hypothetical protein
MPFRFVRFGRVLLRVLSIPSELWTITAMNEIKPQNRNTEHRIARFIRKHQTAGIQDWAARWISFKVIAQHCADLKTPRKSRAGQQGEKFAYDELILAMGRGEFSVNGRSRVLLLVSHGGRVLSVTANELLEAREAFDPGTFEAGYLENCLTTAELVYQWFHRTSIPAPFNFDSTPLLKIKRGRPLGVIDHESDVKIIDRALELRIKSRSERAAVTAAINEADKSEYDKTGSETDRLRTRMRYRRKLRVLNKLAGS